MVYIREKLPNRQYYTFKFVPAFFNLNPDDKILPSQLVEMEIQHRAEVKKWVETANSQFIIIEPNCKCEETDTKIHTFTLKNQPSEKPTQINLK